LICAVLFGLGIRFGIGEERMDAYELLQTGMMLNILLAVFNMLPIYPLDGSRVVDGVMPLKWRAAWERYCEYGPMVLLAVIILPRFIGVSVMSWPMMIATRGIMSVAGIVAGF
jgi:Zn-dependent protease